MSAFHPIATEQRTQFYVGFVPGRDIAPSIPSSASASTSRLANQILAWPGQHRDTAQIESDWPATVKKLRRPHLLSSRLLYPLARGNSNIPWRAEIPSQTRTLRPSVADVRPTPAPGGPNTRVTAVVVGEGPTDKGKPVTEETVVSEGKSISKGKSIVIERKSIATEP